MARPLTLCVLIVLMVVALSAGVARADQRTLDFESLPAGQPVADQYDDGTLGAVQFDYDPTGFHYTGQYAITVADVGTAASSGTHVARLPYQEPLHSPDTGFHRNFGVGFGHSTGYLAFRYTHNSLAMNVGSPDAVTGSPTVPYTLTVYDANGQQLTSQTTDVPLDGHVNHPISVLTFGSAIAYAQIDVPAADQAIDDVTFDVPASPPPPDFGFAWPLRSSGGVTLGSGDTRDVNFTINRINGSNGNITLSAANVPSGVSASFIPNPDAAPGRSAVTMRLTASPLAFLAPIVNQPVTVTATPDPSAGAASRSIVVPVTVLSEYDLRARGLEITQGIQSGGPGEGLPQIALGNRTYRYNGVRLVAFGYKQTIVRFYADALGAPQGGVGADAKLYGTDSSGRSLPGSPLSPDVPSAPLVDSGNGSQVTYADRLDDLHSFDFTLPPSWLSGKITLRGHVQDQPTLFGGTGRECSFPGCASNNDVTLTDIPFTQEAVVSVDPVQIVYNDRTQPGSPQIAPSDPFSPFDVVNRMAPISILPHWWRGTIDVTTHKEFHGFKGWVTRSFIADNNIARQDKGSEVLDMLDSWASDYADVTWPVGIIGYFRQYDGSTSDLGISHHGPLFSGSMPSAVVNPSRPYTSVAHELGHGLGRQHASGGCGGGANGQTAQNWPDPFGYIRGVGIDFSQAGADGGPYKVIAGNQGAGNCQSQVPPDCGGANPAQPFDYMSYCATDSDAWISDIGWNQILNSYNLGARDGAGRAHVAAARPGLMVRGFMTSDGAQVASVNHGRFAPTATDGAASPFRLEAVGAGGQVIGSAPLQVDYAHSDQAGGPRPVAFFQGSVPAPSAAGIRVLDNGAVVAGRDRSPHAPKVRVLSPGRGAVVGRTPMVAVRWAATDADQAPRDQTGLDVSLDYSGNGGRSFTRIYLGPNTGRVFLPRNYLTRSARARLRIAVSDGFNVTTVLSASFRSLGAPPVVHIVNPLPGLVLDQDGTLLLHGEALNDAGARLRGAALTWRAGRQLIGRGELTSTRGLAAGRQRITLTARDAYGRTASTSVQVVLLGVLPAFRNVRFPTSISRRARSVVLSVSASVTTSLRIGSRSFTVGPAVERIRIPLRPGVSAITLRLRLGRGRLTISRAITIARR